MAIAAPASPSTVSPTTTGWSAVSTAGTVFGQGFQGGIRGSIKDAGGVIPGVEVTLNNEQTNIKRSVVTNERGEYVFSNVDPGNYAVKAVLQGYKTIDRSGIRIGTQQFLTVRKGCRSR